jgi:hypothetical protein
LFSGRSDAHLRKSSEYDPFECMGILPLTRAAETSSRSTHMARNARSARPLIDHDVIRRWAEERGAKPSCVRETGADDDIGMIRLDFPGYTGEGKLEEISWDDWFDKFDESGLALLVQDETARGQQSNFSKLVRRDTAEASERGGSARQYPASCCVDPEM